jgi:hypothetical protein
VVAPGNQRGERAQAALPSAAREVGYHLIRALGELAGTLARAFDAAAPFHKVQNFCEGN